MLGVSYTVSPPTNWSGTNIDIYYDSIEGPRYVVDLNSCTPGYIQQTFNTVVGQSYTVSFQLAGNNGGGPDIKTCRVSCAGSFQDYSFDVTGINPSVARGWIYKTFQFTATSASSTLKFESLTPGTCYGPTISYVCVTGGSVISDCSAITETICLNNETRLNYNDGSTLKNTNIFISAGQQVSVSVRGCVSCYIGQTCNSDANGIYNNNQIVGNYNVVFGVMSSINSNAISFDPFSLNSSNSILIGTNTTFIATTSGYLYLGIWDSGTWFDNIGNFCASVTVSASPVTSTPTRTVTPTNSVTPTKTVTQTSITPTPTPSNTPAPPVYPFIVNTKYLYFTYLSDSQNIDNLGADILNKVDSLLTVGDDGDHYVKYKPDNKYNGLTTLIKGQKYLLISKENKPNYTLYYQTYKDKASSIYLNQKITIAKYYGDTELNIDSSIWKNNLSEIYTLNDDHNGYLYWRSNNSFNSLTGLKPNQYYVFVQKNGVNNTLVYNYSGFNNLNYNN